MSGVILIRNRTVRKLYVREQDV